MARLSDDTELDCPVVLSVRCIRKGQVYEYYEAYAGPAVIGLSLGTVGTHLQRVAYEALNRAYADALAERNSIGAVDPGDEK